MSLLVGAIVLPILGFFSSYAKTPDILSHYTDQPIIVDGHIDDWNGLPTTFLEDKGAVIGLANDSQKLYVQIRFREPVYARVIHRSGLTLYFDSKGGKSKDIGLKFVGGPSMAEIREASPQREDSGAEMENSFPRGGASHDQMRNRNDTVFTYFDKKQLIDATIGIEGVNGPQVAWGMDHGFFVYEFAIPLAESKVRDYGLGLEPGKKLGIGAEWGGRPEGMGDQQGPQLSTGGFPGEGGGMMGGGDEDGMGPRSGGREGERSGGDAMRKAFTKQEFWTKTTLASETSKTE